MANGEKPVTASEVRGIVEEVLEKFAVIVDKAFRRERKHNDQRFDNLEKEVRGIKLDRTQDWKEQREFNKRVEKKVDMLDQSVQVLDKRMKYQKDMPLRLEKVENDTYDLKRRVGKVEERAGLTKF